MPFELPGIRIESQNRARIQVVAGAKIAIVIRPRIARSPEDRIRFRIIRTRIPRGSAAGLPRIARPCAEIRLARLRNGVEPPQTFSRRGIIRIEESGDGVLTP